MKTLHVLSISLFFGLLSINLFGQDRLPIIDMHMHTGAPLDLPAGAPAPCLPQPCDRKGQATDGPSDNLEKTLEAMDRYNIVKGFLSDIDLNLLQEWSKAAPGRFIISSFILDPAKTSLDELRMELKAKRMGGVGEIGSQLIGMPPNDPRLDPYFALAEEFDVPVLIHTEGIGPPLPSFRTVAGSPLLLEEVLVNHPKLRIFVENSGYPFLDEMIAMMYQYPQLYGDLSTITWIIPQSAFYDYLKRLIKAGLGKRLMFGSDQMRWPEMIGKGIDAIKEADFLTDEQKRDILYNNAVSFLKMN
ncbi:amidohydrolase family protein [Arenibacter sp. BSSL-BM3]|uniref:Amidohydrolase family protein n=1 Tax=Arenibacter arenosicollis TaxID=2762274 RepID=A0ABR7QSA9_9FLAO|nr:amidohydrolase family protein [Arenibacter arenosicollis]MBC8770082.1 amidohydrolase family protein [Arenibacter arenosicollis]